MQTTRKLPSTYKKLMQFWKLNSIRNEIHRKRTKENMQRTSLDVILKIEQMNKQAKNTITKQREEYKLWNRNTEFNKQKNTFLIKRH